MCYQVKCQNCQKVTWGGCGMHVASAMGGVKDEDRCPNWKGGSRAPCDATPPEGANQSVGSAWLPSFLGGK